MTRDELLVLFDRTVARAREKMEKKNHDYTGMGGPFDNFMASEYVLNMPASDAVLSKVLDKVCRLHTWITTGRLKVDDEPYEDALEDIINFMVLIRGIEIDKQQRRAQLSAD